MLTKKQEEICSLTLWILDHASNADDEIESKKKFTSIIALLNQISAYSRIGHNLSKLTEAMNLLFSFYETRATSSHMDWLTNWYRDCMQLS